MTGRDATLILTIDDERAIRESFRFFLEDYDFEVMEAENGRVGLELFELESPDLILVDLRMPEVSGLEVLKKVTEQSPETPIIVISGTGVLGDAVEALHLGAWDYLLKPVGDLSVLLHSVEKCLERARLRRENREHQEHLEQEVEKRTHELELVNENLRTSEKKFRTLTETSPVAIMMHQDDKWIYSNSAGEELTGYRERELLEMPFWGFVHPDFVSQVKQIEEKRMRDEDKTHRYEFKIIKKDREERWVDLSGGLTEHGGKPAGIVTVIDITEKKRAEEALQDTNVALERRVEERTRELKKAKEAADSAARAKSDFLANMSHEIRTPMNGVIGATELALGEEMAPKLGDYLNIIHTSSYSLLGIINDILDFSKIEAGKLDLDISPFNLNASLDNVSSVFANKMIEQDIEMIIDVAHDIPSILVGDQLRLQQILTNLIGNSFKFTGKSGVIIVNVSRRLLPGELQKIELTFFVRDTGVGMTPEHLSRLFQPFTQADTSTTRKYGGTGLGLTICKQLVELMGGKIWVESEKGKGSTFYFSIPAEFRKDAEKGKFDLPEKIRNLKVLVVDDCEETLFLIKKILTSFGYHVTLAASGRKAMEILMKTPGKGACPFGLIIVDWKMPEMDGMEVIRLIRSKLELSVPVLLLSAFGGEAEVKKMDRRLISGFLRKPFHASGLFDAVVDVFGESGASEKADKRVTASAAAHKKKVKGMRVLLVEDNQTNQEIALAMLKGAGASVSVANNGVEAVSAVLEKEFDVVLMDIQMPEMDGYEATRVIRRDVRFKELPIVAMTANAMKGDEEKCLEAGMNGYISKPVNYERLFRVLRSSTTDVPGENMARAADLLLPHELPGLSIGDTIVSLNIDEESYVRILKGFSRNSQGLGADLKETHAQKAWGLLREMAHTLKGSSGNIGARELLKAASALEEQSLAAVDSAGLSVPEALVGETVASLEIVLSSIEGLQGARENGPRVSQEDPMGKEAAAGLFRGLSEALEQSDPDKIEAAFAKMKNLPDQEGIGQIEDLIESYDFDEALEVLNKMAANLALVL